MKQFQIFILCYFVCVGQFLYAQKWDTLKLEVWLGDKRIELDKKVWIEEVKDSVLISKLQLYISKPYLKISKPHLDYVFWDYSVTKQQIFRIKRHKKNYGLKLGVDSLTNLNCQFSGDLDPLVGMYWTWQNGFIHIKLEGYGQKVLNPKGFFQFHLGGYTFPNNCVGEVLFKSGNGVNKYMLNIVPLLEQSYKVGIFEVLSPGNNTNNLMQVLMNSFIAQK